MVFRFSFQTDFFPAGRIKDLKDATTTITLNYGYGTTVTHQKSYVLSASMVETGLVPRFWAQRQIDELLLFPEVADNEKKVLDIGKDFSIVTPSTSLIVLETLGKPPFLLLDMFSFLQTKPP